MKEKKRLLSQKKEKQIFLKNFKGQVTSYTPKKVNKKALTSPN